VEFVFGYVTVPDREAALSIARAVVGERLAACANVLTDMTSVYHWNGALQTDAECVLVLKTRASLADRLTARVLELHTYECPCVVFAPLVAGSAAYLEWLAAETEPQA
jgi:periplasmic divalent cation tolerance protein